MLVLLEDICLLKFGYQTNLFRTVHAHIYVCIMELIK